MATGRRHPKYCRVCGASPEPGMRISASGLCVPCGDAALIENVRALETHTGEPFRRWRAGVAASVGAMLVDEQPGEA